MAQATRERDSGFEPPLAERVANIAAYDEIYLGFPIWGAAVLRSHAVGARIEDPFVMEADQERRTMTEVKGWLDTIETV